MAGYPVARENLCSRISTRLLGEKVYSSLFGIIKLLRPGGLETRKHLRELKRTQWLSRAELEAWQLARIQRLVTHAYEHVPFYRERFQRQGVHPRDIQSLEDVEQLPLLTKEDVNANLDRLVAPGYQNLYRNQTGGSTGQPMHFFVEDSFWRWNVALELRGRGWYGVREGDKAAWVWGAQRDMPDWGWKSRLQAWVTRQRYLNAFAMTESKMQAFAEMLVQWQPTLFIAYPSALSLLAQYMQKRGVAGVRPRLIETTAEKMTAPQRQLFEEVFQCPVVDRYSARELVTIAYPCELGQLHVCETRYLEIINDGKAASAGQLGEVVITSLHQFAMPLIRYQIGDMGIRQEGDCKCGRGMPILKEIMGRTHDYLVTADGQFVHGEFFAYTFRVKPEVVRYQIYQPDTHHLEIRLVLRQQVSAAWLDNVRNEIRARFGEATNISLQLVDHIELTAAGKHRFIVSDVKPSFATSQEHR